MNLKELAWKYESPALFLKDKSFEHIFLKKAKGVYFWDQKGRKYMDMTSFFGVMNFGHSPDFIFKKKEFLIHGLGDVFSNVYRVKLAEKISRMLGGSYQSIFLNTGSEACEIAVKTAYLCTGKPYIISFKNAYHGLSGISLSLTDRFQKKYFSPFLYKKIVRMPFPGDEVSATKSLRNLKKALKKYPVSSLILEPIQGRGGIRFPPLFFLKELKEICKSGDVILIFDEIFTGLGRTGKMFAHQWYNVKPDIVCIGKGIASGLPLSVCAGKRELMNIWNKTEKETLYASTFSGNPFTCYVALEVLKKLQNMDLNKEVISKGKTLLKELKVIEKKYGKIIKNVRGKGLLIGFDLKFAENIWKTLLFKHRTFTLLEGKNLNTIALSPPFIINNSHIKEFIYKLEKILNKTI
jgi:acetylornithine/succinyldiaminopimelate/putrescine aminotransferase